MASSVRCITQAPIYGGPVRWNANAYIKDPDTHIHKRRARPKSEWLEYRDETLRIVSEELIERVRNRTKVRTSTDERLRSGRKSKYVLSGLLHCGCCNHRYIIVNATSYACSSHVGGRACTNDIPLRRDQAEAALLAPIRKGLLSPERVARMAEEIREMVAQRAREGAGRAVQRPKELAELDARIESVYAIA